MTLHSVLPICVLVLVAAASSVTAQTNVAVCNVDNVLSELDERRDGDAELSRDRDRVREEAKRLRNRILPGLSPRQDDPSPEEFAKEWIQIEIFARVEEWRLNTKENHLIQRLDTKIAAACKLVAEQKKIDLVLIEHIPAIPADLTTLTPDQLRAQLKQKRFVYKSDKVDITRAVIAQLNADHAKSGKR